MCISGENANLAAQYVGQVAQGVSDYRTGKANASLASAEGKSAWRQSLGQAADISNQGARFIGATEAKQAASGVDVSSGSAADVTAESARNIELDRLNELHAGQLKKWSKDVEAAQYKRQARAGLGLALGTLGGGIIGGQATKTILG